MNEAQSDDPPSTSFWDSLTTIERVLGLASWALAALTLIWWGFLVSSEFWAEHAFLLNLASATTGAMFGAPIVVIAFSRFGERVAERTTASQAARVAVTDARAVQRLLEDRYNMMPAKLLQAVRDAWSELSSVARADPTSEQADLAAIHQAVVMDCEIDLDQGRLAVQFVDSDDGRDRIMNLRDSMKRLSDFDRKTPFKRKADGLLVAWEALTDDGPRNPAAARTSPRRLRERRSLQTSADQIVTVLKHAVTIEACCGVVVEAVERSWPHATRTVR